MGAIAFLARWAGRVAASYNEEKWKRLGLLDGENWSRHYGRESYSGKSVTVDTAMQLSAAWGCIRLTSRMTAALPLGLFQGMPDGSRKNVNDEPAAEIIRVSPNKKQTGPEFWETMIAWVAAAGNAYAVIGRNGNGLLASLTPVPTTKMNVHRVGERLVYTANDRGKAEDFPPEKIFHLKWFDMGDDLGLSPIAYGFQSLGSAMAADESSGKVLANGIQNSLMISAASDVSIKEPQREQLSKILEQYSGSSKAGKVMVLPPGFEPKGVSLNPQDAQLLETRRFNVEDICRWWGTPPILVGHASQGQTMWGSGIEQILLAWLAVGMNPLLRNVEARIKKQLVAGEGKRGLYAEFNREGLLQMDSAAKAAFLSSMVQNGLMDRNEGRSKLNLPAREGADKLTAQTNLAPLNSLGAATNTGQNLLNAMRDFFAQDDAKPATRGNGRTE